MGIFDQAIYRMQDWGVQDVILPFVLIFTILFAILEQVKLFGDKAKKHHVVIALVIAIGVVIPHVTGGYAALGYDPITIIQNILPGASLIIVTVVVVAIVMGLLGMNVSGGLLGGKSWVGTGVSILALLALGSVITYNIWPAFLPYELIWWLDDPSTQAVIAILAIFGLVVWYVISPDEPEDATKKQEAKTKFYKDWFGL